MRPTNGKHLNSQAKAIQGRKRGTENRYLPGVLKPKEAKSIRKLC
jgi:hypothetical protein